MKVSAASRRGGRHGLMLIEVLTYIAVFAIVSSVALAAFFRYWDAARGLERATDDIVRTLDAGELWRADVRRAIRTPTQKRESGEEALEISVEGGAVVYLFSNDGVWRRSSPTDPWVHLIPQARQSRMFSERRGSVLAWRWELELAPPKKSPGRLVPRFTFTAVPAQGLPP